MLKLRKQKKKYTNLEQTQNLKMLYNQDNMIRWGFIVY